jgi:hypothetical protein
LVVGGIALKPAVVQGRIEPRQILNLTVVFDHDVIDGAPATRFTQRLVELIESGYGLDEDQALTAVDDEPEAIEVSAFTAGVRFGASSVEQISTYAGHAGGY